MQLPRPRGHRYDAMIEQTSEVAGAAFKEREALEHLRNRLVKALDETASPVAD